MHEKKSKLLLKACLPWAAGSLAVFLSLLVLHSVYRSLPTPLSAIEAGNEKFSEQRARVHLDFLVDTIQTRPYGSDINHKKVVPYLVNEFKRIRGNNDFPIIVGDSPGYSSFRQWTFLWESMNNVIMVIPGEVSDAMLVSAHFDTVSLASGAHDNSVSVSAILDVAHVLSHHFKTKKPYYTIILALIQGEEVGLLGAAAFAEFHPLFINVTHFLNLDGTTGDKSMSFRSSGGIMDVFYKNVPHPLGYSTATDIFNLKLIGSDTDWTIYNRYRTGLDFATYSKRQTYHTLKDKTISEGSLQSLGDNILALILAATSQKSDLWAHNPRGSHNFFSILNRFHINYSNDTAWMFHATAISALACILLAKIYQSHFAHRTTSDTRTSPQPKDSEESVLKAMVLGLLGTCLTFLLTILVSTGFSFVANLYAKLFAYSGVRFPVLALVPPGLTGACLAQYLITKFEGKISPEISQKRLVFGTSTFWLIVGALTLQYTKTVGSVFFLTFYIISATITVVVFGLFESYGFFVTSQQVTVKRNRKHLSIRPEEDLDTEEEHTPEKPKISVPKDSTLPWLIIFCVGFWPTWLVFEFGLALLEFATGAVPAVAFGPLLGLMVFLSISWLLPMTRVEFKEAKAKDTKRSYLYGWLFCGLLILSIFLFSALTLHGRNVFNHDYPYVLEPRQADDVLELRPYFPYSSSLHNMANILDDSLMWQCNSTLCTVSNKGATEASFTSKCDRATGHAAIEMSTPGAWIHLITFELPQNVSLSRLWLNGIEMDRLPRNFDLMPLATPQHLASVPFRFHLNSTEHTKAWTISFDFENLKHATTIDLSVESFWAESPSVPVIQKWLTEKPTSKRHVNFDSSIHSYLPEWMSFVGHGMRGIASRKQTVSVCN